MFVFISHFVRSPLYLLIALAALASLSWSSLASASSLEQLQQRWAEVNYQMQGNQQLSGFETLISDAGAMLEKQPESAPLLIWRGIIQSTYAGAKGGLGALKVAKAAKRDFEKAMTIDADALDGSAYTSLGTLYANVPGWPIGFGSDKQARRLLEKAQQINPQGIDSNYFYAEYLRGEGELELARQHYQIALQAPTREGRALADQGRRQEIIDALEKL